MDNTFSLDSLLYYPTIEFQDETWVKSALIFWDKIYRIVPLGYYPKDSDEILIAKDSGLIEDIRLTEDDLEKTADEFEQFCEELDFFPGGFDASLYNVRLHSDKIDERLKPYFRQFSEAVDKEGFYKIPERVANGYMFFLSDTVSKRRSISKLTDNPDMFAAMSYFDVEGHFDDFVKNENATDIYTTLVIENLLPADIKSISIERLIKLNKNLEEYKKEFKKRISDFNEKLVKVEDKDMALSLISDFKKEISEVSTTKTEILKTYIDELKLSLVYIGLPVATASIIGSLYSVKEDLFSIGTEISKGIGMGAVAAITAAGRDIRKRWSSKKSNYYLELRKELVSNEKVSIKNFTGRIDEFLND